MAQGDYPVIFEETTSDGTTIINYENATALFLITVMMIITFSIMVICGVLTARMLRKTTMSKKMFEIQKQLLKALTVQALIPFALAYMPRFVMFFFVVMGYPPLKIFSYTPLIITLYTVLDPIAIILFVNHYRLAVVDMVVVPFRRTSVGSTIEIQPMSTRSSYADIHRATETAFTHTWKRSL
ncbi:unnamed protein product [Cylicocyclus nassatus]|uniref:G protein-coupled receptor n=1 Tax=Cylicocyclus nassatus TaxID=53992 RepID=A0AA36DLF6_CYLNA|nr:unnamed protein product [Cylicocyclus nassatus]